MIGILIPESVTDWLGVSENTYRIFSATMGTLAGTAMLAGLAILIVRRLRDRRVAATTRGMDVAVMALLAFMVATGMWNTVVENLINGGYNYRETVSPWFRGLFLLNPKASPDDRERDAAQLPAARDRRLAADHGVAVQPPGPRLERAVTYLRPQARSSTAHALPRRVRVGAGGLSADAAASLANSPKGAAHVHQ